MFEHGIGYQLWLMGCHLSRFFNFLMGGSLEDTFSLRVAKTNNECPVCTFCCKILDWFDKGHCTDSVAWWEIYKKNPDIVEHRPIIPWVILWSTVGLIFWFRPFGLI